MRYFPYFLPICLVLMALPAQAKRDPLPKVELPPTGPKSVAVSLKDIKKIRDFNNTYYEVAREFSEKFGDHFIDLVESRLSPDDYTNIVIAMGGAEHLGTLLELGLIKRGLRDRVNISYVDLSTEIVRPWRATRIGDPMRVRVGLGPIPYGWEQEVAVPSGSIEELADRLRDLDLPDRKLLVIDTCCQGSIAESVAAVMRYWRPDSEPLIEGILLHHNRQFQYQHTIPFFNLSDESIGDKPDTWRWSWMVDEGRIIQHAQHGRQPIFQRSDKIVAKPNQALENYKATLLGLYDGLQSSTPSPCARLLRPL